MMVNLHALNVQQVLPAIQEILLENQHAQQECTHLKVTLLADLAQQALCAQIQLVLEYLNVLMELSLKWVRSNVLTAQRVSFVLSKIKL